MTLQEYKKQKMQNPDFSAAYDEIQPEMDIIRAIIDARISQNVKVKSSAPRQIQRRSFAALAITLSRKIF